MSAAELELLAERLERRSAPLPTQDDAFFLDWRDNSGPGCLPCLLEDLE